MGGEGGQPSCSWTQHHFDFSSVHASFVSQLKATQAGQLCGQFFWFLVLVQSTLPWHRPAEFEFRGHPIFSLPSQCFVQEDWHFFLNCLRLLHLFVARAQDLGFLSRLQHLPGVDLNPHAFDAAALHLLS